MGEDDFEGLSGKKVLITGGLGFIGSNLAKRCLDLGAQEVELFSSSLVKEGNVWDTREDERVKVTIGDITDKGAVESAIVGKDVIFHLAGQTSHIVSMEDPLLDIDINLVGTINVLEACRRLAPKARVVGLGSVSQLGVAEKLPIHENMKDAPLEIYSANKLICEKYFGIYARAYGLYTSFLRLGTIYGERQRLDNHLRGITNFFVGRIMLGKPVTVYGKGEFMRDYIHVSDVVEALVLCVVNSNARGKAYLIGGDKIQFIDMVRKTARAVEKVAGKKGDIQFIEFPGGEKKLDVGDTVIDSSKIEKDIGWKARLNFEEGIERTIRYYQANNKFGEYLTR